MIITKKGAAQKIINIEETFRAPKEKVFKAWTKPESLKKWFMADAGVTVTDVAINLNIGGYYFIETIFPGYEASKIEGEFLKIEVPKALEYTWHTPILNGKTTKVEVEFIDFEQGSKILLNHGVFENKNEMQLHIQGWKGCINKLHDYLKIS